MKHYPEMEDDGEEAFRPRDASRRAGPRFGPLLTIAVAILVLFGAASRLGKPQAGDGLFSLDLSAKNRLEEDRLRSEEERLRTIVSIGALSATVKTGADALPSAPVALGARLDPNPLPPERGDFDLDALPGVRGGVVPVSAAAPVAAGAGGMALSIPGEIADNYDRTARFDPAPEAVPGGDDAPKKTYTVRQGDTWVKVAQKTGKRWQDLQKANPASAGGLRVGMKLVLP